MLTDPFFTGLMSSALAGLMGFLIWLMFHRPAERDDKRLDGLEKDVLALRDQRVTRLEEESMHNQAQRGKIYGDIAAVRQTFMHKEECLQKHRAESDRMAEFHGAVLKLERVGERADAALKRAESLQEEFVHLTSQIAVVAAKVQTMQEGNRHAS